MVESTQELCFFISAGYLGNENQVHRIPPRWNVNYLFSIHSLFIRLATSLLVAAHTASTALAIIDLILFSMTRRHIYDPLFISILRDPQSFLANFAPATSDVLLIGVVFCGAGVMYTFLWKFLKRKVLDYLSLNAAHCVFLLTATFDPKDGVYVPPVTVWHIFVFIMAFVGVLLFTSAIYIDKGTVRSSDEEIIQCAQREMLPFYVSLFCEDEKYSGGVVDYFTPTQKLAQKHTRPVIRSV